MVTPHVQEVTQPRQPIGADDFARDEVRSPRRPPYNRAAQRRMVLLALATEGRFDDYHGDSKR